MEVDYTEYELTAALMSSDVCAGRIANQADELGRKLDIAYRKTIALVNAFPYIVAAGLMMFPTANLFNSTNQPVQNTSYSELTTRIEKKEIYSEIPVKQPKERDLEKIFVQNLAVIPDRLDLKDHTVKLLNS